MSLEGGLEDVDEFFRAEASCLSNSSILINAAASRLSISANREANRSQFRHAPRRILIMRQFTFSSRFHLHQFTDP